MSVDGATPLFGEGSGRVIRDIAVTPERDRFTCTWSFRQVEFEQVIELIQVGDRVAGPQELAVTLEPGAVVGRTTVDVEATNLIR